MAKILIVAGLLLATTAGAFAQSSSGPSGADEPAGNAGVRSGNITSTGATVPNPGASQSAGTTQLDRGIQREDNRIDSGICKGC